MKYFYKNNTLETKLQIEDKTIILKPLELLNIFIQLDISSLSNIQEIEETIYKRLTGEQSMPTYINLFNIDRKQNEDFFDFMGYDKSIRTLEDEINNIKSIVKELLFPHKTEFIHMRNGNAKIETKRISSYDIYNNSYGSTIFTILKENISKIEPSISSTSEYKEVIECNSIIPFIWNDILKCIKDNIAISECEICEKYFISSGRIGKTGNKYCSNECRKIIRARRMRERRST